MTTKSDTARASLQRDITEALLRLKLARAKRDRKDIKECQEKLDWLLDRLAIHLNLGGGS
jgi:hypothetical protein